MNNLPKNWILATLNDLLGDGSLYSDGDWIESKHQDPDVENRLLQLADIGDGYFLDKSSHFVNDEMFESLNCTEVKEGDVLIARMPEPLGRACLVPRLRQRCLTVVDIAIFRSGGSGIHNKYLMHLLNSPSVREQIELNSTGTTRRRIARGTLGQLKLPIPPRAEQIRIARKMDELLTNTHTLKTKLNSIPLLLDIFRRAVLAAAISGELTKQWRAENSKSQKDIESNIDATKQKLPNEWRETRFETIISDLRYGTAQKCEYNGGTLGVLRIPNIVDHGIDLQDLKSSNFKESERLKLALEEGDLLIVRSNGSVEIVGKSAVVTKKEVGLLFAGYLIRARINKDRALPDYVNFWIKSPKIRDTIESHAKSTSGVNNINSDEIKSLTFTMPPLAEQAEIIRRIDKLFAFSEQLERKTKAAKSVIDNLEKSVSYKAFRGDLVPQDESDGSASYFVAQLVQQASARKFSAKIQKNKSGLKMKIGKIVSVLDALTAAGTALTGQDLLRQAGYPSDATTDQIEQFFLDIRKNLDSGTIKRDRPDSNGQDFFSISER